MLRQPCTLSWQWSWLKPSTSSPPPSSSARDSKAIHAVVRGVSGRGGDPTRQPDRPRIDGEVEGPGDRPVAAGLLRLHGHADTDQPGERLGELAVVRGDHSGGDHRQVRRYVRPCPADRVELARRRRARHTDEYPRAQKASRPQAIWGTRIPSTLFPLLRPRPVAVWCRHRLRR
jgi:hypothetical protein